MTNEELLSAIKLNVQNERRSHAQFLLYLREVDDRKLYFPQYKSLFDFCVKELGLSEASASKRIQVARLSRTQPDVIERIRDQKLTLSNASLIAPHLPKTPGLLFEALGKSKREVEKIVARVTPKPDTPESLRKVTFPGERKPTVKPLSEKRTQFVFCGDDETVAMYRALQDRLRHKYPKGGLEQIVKEAFTLLLKKTDPAREPERKVTPRPPTKHTRFIPAQVRRSVWQRDGGKCTEKLPSGMRCCSQSALQIDHIVPWSLGGSR